MTSVIRLQGLVKDYPSGLGPVRILHGIDLLIEAGEFVAVMGPSGSGKSTLMNILGCLDSASGGDFALAGQTVNTLDTNALADLQAIVNNALAAQAAALAPERAESERSACGAGMARLRSSRPQSARQAAPWRKIRWSRR